MKKGLIRLFATATVVVALLFVIVLLVTVFGGITSNDFDNSLVKGLFVALGCVFVAFSVTTLVMLFINEELVKEIVLRTDKDGATRTTVGVIKKIAKKTSSVIPGVKCVKCAVVENEFGVRLKITVKVKGKNVDDVDAALRTLLDEAFMGALSFRFYSIEIKVKKLTPAYTVNATEVERVLAEQKEKAKKEEQAVVAGAEQGSEKEEVTGGSEKDPKEDGVTERKENVGMGSEENVANEESARENATAETPDKETPDKETETPVEEPKTSNEEDDADNK